MRPDVLRLHPSDNVAVALRPLQAETEVSIDGSTTTVRESIPAGHKVALVDFAVGTTVVKYGEAIGEVTRSVERGQWLHSHNMKTRLAGEVRYRYEPVTTWPQTVDSVHTFDGYRRSNGAVGTRNEVWILNTVGCVSQAADRIARICREEFGKRVEGIHSFAHPHGCSQSGADLDRTRRILAGLAAHPNTGGVLLLGLGCEEVRIDYLVRAAAEVDPARLRFFNSQDVDDEVEYGVAMVRELVAVMEKDRRSECPLTDLVVGVECGGSDGLSGVTANPLVGRITDRITAEGGGAILSEVPEMFGAEHTLMNRAITESVFHDIERLVNDFKQYYREHGRPIYENPSPGNIEGGLTTLEEKSLGAIRKGGSSRVTEVLRYGERKKVAGLSLLETPGNDAVSTTAKVAAGATVILFTTGRGTPLGSPAPTIKISSNTALSEKKPRWIDFNAGSLSDGTAEMGDLDAGLFELLLDVASGRVLTKNERYDYRDIAIWKMGVTH